MSISNYYQTLSVYELTDGSFSTPAGYVLKRTFKGLVQSPSNSNTFNNNKDTSAIDGVLFTSIKESFDSKDIIEDTDATRYIMSGQGSQTKGITGVTPMAGQHAEYTLTNDNGSL